MYKLQVVLLFTFLLSGCSEISIEAPSTTTSEDKQLQTKALEDTQLEQTGVSEPAKNVKHRETNPREVHEAENLVRQYLELADSTETIVEYDHSQQGRYVIHVYDIIDLGKKTEHTATRGWYLVNLSTKDIEVLQ